MSTVIVCLRSRLLSEAVAQLLSESGGLAATAADPVAVIPAVREAGDTAAVVVDAGTAQAIDGGGLDCPVVAIGRREEDTGGLECVVTSVPLHVDGAGLVDALRAVLQGAVPPVGRSAGSTDRRRRATDSSGHLTPREREVLELISRASTPQEIVSALGVSEHTVRTHVQNLLGKLGATSKVDAVARARSLGLLDAGRGP